MEPTAANAAGGAGAAGGGTDNQIAELQAVFDQASKDAQAITAARTEGNTKVDAARQRPNN